MFNTINMNRGPTYKAKRLFKICESQKKCFVSKNSYSKEK